jgi:adenylate kinase
MKSGGLVSDKVMIRLILNELSIRGWVSTPQTPLNLNSMSIGETHQADQSSADEFLNGRSVLEAAEKGGLQTSDSPAASFLLDGFPRTVTQAEQLTSNDIDMNLVINISTPLDIVVDRISNRWLHAASGRVYNNTFNPPKTPGFDDVTGEPLTRRADDDPETFKSRWNKFLETANPLSEFYERTGVLYKVEGETSDEITPKIIREVERRFC